MPQACLAPDIIRAFPKVRTLLFISTTDSSTSGYDYTHVANNPGGYVVELERCGQATATMGTRAVATNPYSTRLMPVSPLDDLRSTPNGVLLESAEFIGYDSTRAGSAHQNANNVTAIEASQASATDAYVASHFRGGIAGNWQPNFCRPEILVNGELILGMNDTDVVNPATGARSHMGHLGIGVPLPFLAYYYREFDRISSLDVFCGLAQWIETSAEAVNKLQRYPVQAILTVRLR
jgi:hypothetical protein